MEFNQNTLTPSGLANQWLDLDTFKLSSVNDETRKVNAVTLTDINALVERLNKKPTVGVIVSFPVTIK